MLIFLIFNLHIFFIEGKLFGRELLVIFWQTEAKDCLEVPARVRTLDPQIPSLMP